MSATTTNTQRIDVDPRTLLVDVNIRHDVRLNKDFVASIKELGVLVPIGAVRTASGELRVRYGHRRALAALEAGSETVPVEVLGDEGTDDAAEIERIVTQHAENVHRAGLTAAEEVGVVEQLSAFGMSAFQIQKRTRMKKAAVDEALAVASSELAKAATARYDFLSLAQASAVAEFEDDSDAVKALVVAAKDGNFEHTLQRLRDDREEAASRRDAEQALTEAGVTIVERPGWNDTVTRLSQLTNEGEALDGDTHRNCPGHAAFLEQEWESSGDEESDEDDDAGWTLAWSPIYVCTDPTQHGHVDASAARSTHRVEAGSEADEAAKAERKRVLANNKAWRSAETVRRDWLRQLLARKTAPKDAARYIFGELARGGYELRQAMERSHPLACQLLGIENESNGYGQRAEPIITAFADASDGRAQVIALGLVLAAQEDAIGVHSWRSPTEGTERYLLALSEWGYGLSDVEKLVTGEGEAD